MSKIGQPAKTSSSLGENGSSQGERMSTVDEGKRPYTLFQGHSGPVYSVAFSPFGDFLLSSSSDSTSKTPKHSAFTFCRESFPS
jgi:transcription initiation factor TFIID subunit 5